MWSTSGGRQLLDQLPDRAGAEAIAGLGQGLAASIYGKARATTPLLDEELSGPVYLRSSSNKLPDLVVALHSGKIDVNVVGRIDWIKGGRIRNSFEAVPDAPVSRSCSKCRAARRT